jgi:hypothetical protein
MRFMPTIESIRMGTIGCYRNILLYWFSISTVYALHIEATLNLVPVKKESPSDTAWAPGVNYCGS